MVWLKLSDTAAQHPVVLGPLTEPVPAGPFTNVDTVNLLFGMVIRCAIHSAQFTTDYVISDSTVASIAGPDWLVRAQLAEKAGYWQRAKGGWLLVDDSDHFVHIRRKAELDWEKARKRDNSDVALTVPVRLRDGDACRYCGKIVNWSDRKSTRGGTYDHAIPGTPARTPDDLLVACQGCNGFRSNRPDANESRPAKPPPVPPFYGAGTAEFLRRNGYVVPQTPGNQLGTSTAATRHPGRPGDAAPRPRHGRSRDDARTQGDTTALQPGEHQPRQPARATLSAGPSGRRFDRDQATGLDATPVARGTGGDPASRGTSRQDDAARTEGEARGPAQRRPRGAPAAPPDLPDPADPARSQASGIQISGSGRDGSGRVPPTLATPRPGEPQPASHRAQKRRRR